MQILSKRDDKIQKSALLNISQKTPKKGMRNKWNQNVSKYKNRTEMTQVFNEIFDPNYKRIKQFFCNES